MKSIPELYQLFLASDGICTDSRKIQKGTLFFALKGDNFNGNEFAVQAIEEGCQYAVMDEAEHAQHENCLLVEDVLKTLQDLANHHRKQFDIPVLAITGSNGKTTTKELIGAVLEKKFNLLITQGNLNNHLGVPFTLLRLKKEHDFAVIEMGANKPGDIQELVDIAEPNYGIITNVGAAHIEGFGSFEGVINTKTELYRFIESKNGLLFYNAGDEKLIGRLPAVETFSYGEGVGDVQGELRGMTPFVSFKWRSKDYTSETLETKLVGRYNFSNFLAAVAIGVYFKVDPKAINQALINYTPSNNRSQIQRSERNTLIVDCYNANATSMKAAIDSLNEMEHDHKLAILGDMLELGEISKKEHQKVVDQLAALRIKAILVGNEFAKTSTSYPQFENYTAVIESGKLADLKDHLVLLKGSRGIKLENLIDKL